MDFISLLLLLLLANAVIFGLGHKVVDRLHRENMQRKVKNYEKQWRG